MTDRLLLPTMRSLFAADYEPPAGGGGRFYLMLGTLPAAFEGFTGIAFFVLKDGNWVGSMRDRFTATTHVLDNIGGGIGRPPNEATRKRMAERVDSWPRLRAEANKSP
jgi:hypothetical protein